MSTFLGIDLGTSGVKVLLIDGDQKIIGSSNAPLDVQRPHPGWSEQRPADWLTATDAAISALRSSHPAELSAVAGIGLSGHMHGATLLNASGNVLRPCILWNDTRSFAEAAELDHQPLFRELTGNIVFPGFTAPKLLWVARHEPEILAQLSKVLLPKDYLRLWLTGEYVSEMSDSAGTSWLDTGRRAWDERLLAATGLDLSHMPNLVEGTAVSGQLRGDLKSKWGIEGNVAVAGGAGDNAASACGMGTVAPGTAFVSLGTSGVLFASNDAYRPNPASAVHAFCHAIPGTWHQMGVILSATDSLNWLSGVTGKDAAALTGGLSDSLAAPGPEMFLPYLSGERTPHNDASVRGAFTGLSHESGPQALTKAVLEGVAFAIRDSLDALQMAGTELSRVTAIGGGSRSIYWLKIIAATLGIPVDIPAEGDFGAAFGAARLGLIAATGADPLAICAPPATARTIEPDASLTAAFHDAHQRYKHLYPAIKGAFA
jgi:xylulokinase